MLSFSSFKIFSCSDSQIDLSACPFVFIVTYSCRIQHSLGRDHRWCILVFVTVINDRLDTGLNDCLGTFITREQGNVKFRPFQASASVIQNRIQFAVRNIQILRIQWFTFPCPRKLIIRTDLRKSIITSRVLLVTGISLPLWLNLLCSQCILLIPAIVYVFVMKIDIIKCIPYRKIKVLDAISSLFIGYCLIPLILLINVISSLFSTNYLNSSTEDIVKYPFLIQLLIMAVMPIIAEEFVFRGLFYHSYRKNGILGAAVLSGLVFGAIHLNINQFCYAFVMGIIFALMVEVTGSMFSSMIAHFAVNSYSIIMLKIVSSMENISGQTNIDTTEVMAQYSTTIVIVQLVMLIIMTVIFLSIAFLLFMAMAKRNGRWEYLKENLKKGFKPQNNEHFITIPLVATLIAAFVFMIIQEI